VSDEWRTAATVHNVQVVEPLAVRDEAPLAADDLVVRSGTMPRDALTKAARDCYLRNGYYGISVAAGAGLNVDDFYRRSDRLRLGRKHRVTTAGALRGLAGFGLLATSRAPHYTLVIPGPVDDLIWESITGVFGEVESAPEWVS
jgi:hypothetical protein